MKKFLSIGILAISLMSSNLFAVVSEEFNKEIIKNTDSLKKDLPFEIEQGVIAKDVIWKDPLLKYTYTISNLSDFTEDDLKVFKIALRESLLEITCVTDTREFFTEYEDLIIQYSYEITNSKEVFDIPINVRDCDKFIKSYEETIDTQETEETEETNK